MAVWQFDVHLVPRNALLVAWGAVPATTTRRDLDDENWFADAGFDPNIEDFLAHILPEARSWSADLRIWGKDDGHRIDVNYDKTRASSIFVRISTKDDLKGFLPRLIDLCRQFDLVLVTEDFDVLPPDLARVQQTLRESSAFRFAQTMAEEGSVAAALEAAQLRRSKRRL